ncbi:hypothetical protein K488DRAFT_47575, partial [Vararia minispora EC-137]
STFKGRPKTTPRDVRDAFKEPTGLPLTAEPEPIGRSEKPTGPPVSASALRQEHAMPASTTKARKVMQWFRSRSKGGDADDGSILESEAATRASTFGKNSSTTSINIAQAPIRSASEANASFGERVMRRAAPRQPGVLRVHHGAVDQTTITTMAPPEVMRRVRAVLDGMGIDVQEESEFKYRCIRGKKRRLGRESSSTSGLAAVHMVDKRGLPVPSPPPPSSLVGSTGGMLKGLLMRRQSSQVSAAEETQPSPDASEAGVETIYGDVAQDVGDEVRFYVELTRIDRLNDTFSLDIRRLKGNLRSYKFLYDTVRE